MIKKSILYVILLSLLLLAGCQSQPNQKTDPSSDKILEIKDVLGLDDVLVTKNEYFNPLKSVKITNQSDQDITHLLEVTGSVHYGTLGEYELTYALNYGNDVINQKRVVTVLPGTITRETHTRQTISGTIVESGLGSYRIGSAPSIAHPVNPQRLNQDLLTSAVPSNSWWTSLLVANYGLSNGIYTNPLRSSFSNNGVEITNPGAGFVQYWNPEGYNTMANFSLVLPDMFIKSSDLALGYTTHVVDYSDTTVKVAMRNNNQPADHMVMTYAQGSPYVFAEVANSNASYITLAENGVDNYEYYTLEGTPITGASYVGDAMIVKLVRKHVGYETSRPSQVGQPIFSDRYFLVSAPSSTQFSLSSSGHSRGLINRINLSLGDKNYFSVAAIKSINEGAFYHQHAYTKTLYGDVSYQVDMENSHVETTYHMTAQYLKDGFENAPLQFLLPHQYEVSQHPLTDYTFQTVRGTLKLIEGATFKTHLSFYGMLPGMTLPTNNEFSDSTLSFYLSDLDQRTQVNDSDNFLNDDGPYWNSKALYPLAQGLIMADQMGDDALKFSFISKLRYLLSDWFTYSGSNDSKYLYYNEAWGTVYYSNNDFNTASELSDHSFTHGYLVYAASVLSMYDPLFADEYGDIITLLLNDYMYPHKDDYNFEHLRSFDPWAGHTWAHGFGTFAEGNNLESSSEAIHSWLGGYLWALNQNDQALRDAAIYGFVHELHSAKTYMFDYQKNIFPSKYSDYASVAGMIWGGKYDYATWFGANPTFIYGIQWLPNGEYLSGYALNDFEKGRLSQIYNHYLSAKNQNIDTWYANMWSIQALINPTLALNQFDASKILNDDYPSDLSQTYYLLNGLKAFGSRTTDYQMKIHDRVSSSIYEDENGIIHALVWNASDSSQTIIFVGPSNLIITKTIPARSFQTIRLN